MVLFWILIINKYTKALILRCLVLIVSVKVLKKKTKRLLFMSSGMLSVYRMSITESTNHYRMRQGYVRITILLLYKVS